MRVTATLALIAVLALGAPPAAAQTAPVLECNVPEGTPVLGEGTTQTTLPQPPGDSTEPVNRPRESVKWVLDLGDVPAGTTATLAVHEEWQIRTNNWDLLVTAGKARGFSWNNQPVMAPEENVTLTEVQHCVTVEVTSYNNCTLWVIGPCLGAVAAGDLDPLETTLTVSNIRQP